MCAVSHNNKPSAISLCNNVYFLWLLILKSVFRTRRRKITHSSAESRTSIFNVRFLRNVDTMGVLNIEQVPFLEAKRCFDEKNLLIFFVKMKEKSINVYCTYKIYTVYNSRTNCVENAFQFSVETSIVAERNMFAFHPLRGNGKRTLALERATPESLFLWRVFLLS